MARTTRAFAAGGHINARGAVGINAIASQGVSSVDVGGAVGNIGGPCFFPPWSPDLCDDAGFPAAGPNWSFGDNLMPGAAGAI